METKHTQGKWTFINGFEHKLDIMCNKKTVAIVNDGVGVAPLEIEANAKLIASAPIMLEGLIELKKLFNELLKGTGSTLASESEAFREQYKLICKLIKQATE